MFSETPGQTHGRRSGRPGPSLLLRSLLGKAPLSSDPEPTGPATASKDKACGAARIMASLLARRGPERAAAARARVREAKRATDGGGCGAVSTRMRLEFRAKSDRNRPQSAGTRPLSCRTQGEIRLMESRKMSDLSTFRRTHDLALWWNHPISTDLGLRRPGRPGSATTRSVSWRPLGQFSPESEHREPITRLEHCALDRSPPYPGLSMHSNIYPNNVGHCCTACAD